MAALALLVLVAAFQTQPLAIAAPSDETVLGLLKRIPAFAATSGRSGLRLTGKNMVMPQSNGKGHFIEFQWTEKGATHTGLAAIVHNSVGEDKPRLVKGDPWGIGMMAEDKDWDYLISDLSRSQISANEAAMVGQIRMVISAQAGFQGASGGGFGEMRCLARPAECIPGYTGPHFLDEELASAVEKNGYRREFHAGPRVAGAGLKPAASPLSKTFAYTAVPSRVGDTGQRSFCGDSSGRVCALASGAAPAVAAGACPASCPDLK